nr:zinc finger BED domain-containing protein RICESLEEPER 2-like [Ipomoea batatas]
MFFPIIWQEHYFLLCSDFCRFRLEIIDNSSSPAAKMDKYGECLVDMEFFTKTHPGRSMLCAGLEPKRMQMPWRDFNNKIDCGVYLMRHMETFTSQAVRYWDCGLVKGEYSMLHKLRLQYMKDLVLSEYNLHRSRNLARAYQSISESIGFLVLPFGIAALHMVFLRDSQLVSIASSHLVIFPSRIHPLLVQIVPYLRFFKLLVLVKFAYEFRSK